VVEIAGNETFLHVASRDHLVVARVGPDLRPQVGATVFLGADPENVHFFEAESGLTL
jgi:multiple sugar transport system ATP-binding protein